MQPLSPSTPSAPARRRRRPSPLAALLACALLLASPVRAQAPSELERLTTERETLTRELEQYQRTLALIPGDASSPGESSNPAVRTLAQEMVRIKERLIAVTEREVTLLQEQITTAREVDSEEPPPDAMESRPLRPARDDYTREQEMATVERLHQLLADYYAELQEAARTLPSEEELAQRAAALRDAEQLARIPFSPDKVRLNGAEASTALSQITRRLSDPNIPESRRDMAPICAIKTYLFGSLIFSENRSLKPVGKNHYVARLRLQPGDTSLHILDHRWEVQLPQHVNAGDFLVTYYAPPGSEPELHLFAIDDLLAEQRAHIPAWLPAEIHLPARAG